MNYSDTYKKIKSGKPYPIYVLSGEEDYYREQCVNLLIDRFVDDATKDFNFNVLRGGDVEEQSLYNLLTSFPMMSEKRVVLIKEANLLTKNVKEVIKKYIKKPVISTVLILEAESIKLKEENNNKKDKGANKKDKVTKKSKSKSFWAELKDKSLWLEFKRLYQNQIFSWIKRFTEKKGKKINQDAAAVLVELCGKSLRDISNEIEKIILYIGDKNYIDKDAVFEVTGSSKLFNIWELCDSVGQKKLSDALKIVDKMLEKGESPIGIIIMLTRHMSFLLKIKKYLNENLSDKEIAKKLKTYDSYVKKYIAQSNKFSESEIERCFGYLLHADFLLKRGVRNFLLLMNLLILQLVGSIEHTKSSISMTENKKFEILRELSEIYLVR